MSGRTPIYSLPLLRKQRESNILRGSKTTRKTRETCSKRTGNLTTYRNSPNSSWLELMTPGPSAAPPNEVLRTKGSDEVGGTNDLQNVTFCLTANFFDNPQFFA